MISSSLIEIFTDGGARGNPGPAATGFVVKKNGAVVHQHGEFIGEATNNVAEYTAVLKALNWLKNDAKSLITNHRLPITLYLDSKLVVEQLSGRWRIKKNRLQTLAWQIKKTAGELPAKISYQYIPRAQNRLADALVNASLDEYIEFAFIN